MRICFCVLTAILLVNHAQAAPMVIDFESVPSGLQMSYIESGVTFTTLTNSEFFAANSPNGSLGIVADFFAGLRPLFRADIAGGASSVSVDLGDFNVDEDLLMLLAFDASDNLVDQALVPIAADFTGMQTLSVFGSDIAYVLFGGDGGDGSSVYADNFTVETATTAVPEPASLALLSLGGLGLVGGWSRRRKTSG